MLVRNWMHADPMTIASDVLVSEAKRLMSEHQLHALPVVENGRLRGLVTRANLLRMGQFVLRTQNSDEFDYFVSRLRVRDIMLRRPACMQVDDTMADCLRRGQQLGVAQFPVLDGDELVGVISANEIFQLAAHCVGASEDDHAIMLAPMRLAPGVLARVCAVAEAAGAALHGLYPVGVNAQQSADADNGTQEPGQPAPARVIIRFGAPDPQSVLRALVAAGFEPFQARAGSAKRQAA